LLRRYPLVTPDDQDDARTLAARGFLERDLLLPKPVLD
jgi:hypothetical protein